MIVRILGEGQFDLPDSALDALNALDAVAESAVDADDQPAFTAALTALLDAVRRLGAPTAPDLLVPSSFVLPPADVTLAEVRHLFEADGLVPG